jgi:hypothetical protein
LGTTLSQSYWPRRCVAQDRIGRAESGAKVVARLTVSIGHRRQNKNPNSSTDFAPEHARLRMSKHNNLKID